MPGRADLPRRTAYDVLAAVADREAYANLLLPRLLAERSLTGRDAALATELAYGTLRGMATYDAVLAACSDRPLGKLDPPVLRVLRLGVHQLLGTRIGGHAAVATSVDLAKAVAGPRASGYVNAVLRRVSTRNLDQWLAIAAPDPQTDPDGHLAVRYSHPRWIIAAYREALGEAAESELAAALAAGNERPRVTLAAFPAGPGRDAVMPAGAEPTRWSPFGFTLAGGDPSRLVEGLAEGTAAVQDEGSQLAAIALAAAPLRDPPACGPPARGPAAREHWLDMCAGPGGKARLLAGLAAQAGRAAREAAADQVATGQVPVGQVPVGRAPVSEVAMGEVAMSEVAMSEVAMGEVAAGAVAAPPRDARLLAADIHPHRAALVKAALGQSGDRLPGGSRPAVLVADGRRPPWRDGGFDRVLVDAPCTGLGALRRRPEARWRKSESDLPALTELQRALLRSALAACRQGGVVGYVTCSPVPAETRDVVHSVVADTADVEILDAPALLPGVPGLRSPSPRFAQLWPHRHGTDAIFIALLRRG